MITTERLAEIAARLEARTPGEWESDLQTLKDPICYLVVTDDPKQPMWGIAIARDVKSKPDADLIAHAPADIADLLAEVARLRLQVAYLEDKLPQYGEYGPGGAAYDEDWKDAGAVADDSEVTS